MLIFSVLLFGISACGGINEPYVSPVVETLVVQPEPELPVEPDLVIPWKVAIVTNTVDQNEEEYRSAENLVARFGEDKAIHRTWPIMFGQEGDMMIQILEEIVSDPEVGVLIINQAVINTNAAVDSVRELRGDDIFIVYAQPVEAVEEVAERANLLFNTNDTLIGYKFVHQAIAMGAETIVHYSFPRHMAVPLLAMRRDVMKETAEANGIKFVELEAPDPMGDGGMPMMSMSHMHDVPRRVEEFGVNTAFFGTNCGMQITMIEQVVATGAIYPQPCCPSPYHGFPTALGITSHTFTGEYDEYGNPIFRLRDLHEVIDEVRSEIARRGASGRLSTWPIPTSMLYTTVAFEYGVKWLNGEVPRAHGEIDLEVLAQIFEDIIAVYAIDEGLSVGLATLELDGVSFSHYILAVQDYLVF